MLLRILIQMNVFATKDFIQTPLIPRNVQIELNVSIVILAIIPVKHAQELNLMVKKNKKLTYL